jgi:cbb3-type cytochrome oxidase subunit 3
MLVGTVLFMLINYLGQKFFAFRKENNKENREWKHEKG